MATQTQVDHPQEVARLLRNLTENDSFRYMCQVVEENTQLKQEIQKVRTANEVNDDKIIRLKQDLHTLQAESAQKDDKLSHQAKEKTLLANELGKKKKELGENAKLLAELRGELKNRDDKIGELENALGKEREKSKDRDILWQQLEGLKKDLVNREERLRWLEGFAFKLTPLREKGDLPTHLSSLFAQALAISERYFAVDLPKDVLGDMSLWKDLKRKNTALANPNTIPLPVKNSPVANKMRVATFLSLLSSELVRHVFQPVYFLPQSYGGSEQAELGGVLSRLATADSEMETYLRSVMLRSTGCMEPWQSPQNMVRVRVDTVVKNVLDSIGSLVIPGQNPGYGEFAKQLQECCERAADIWRYNVQSLKEKVEPSFRLFGGEEGCWLPLSAAMGASSVLVSASTPTAWGGSGAHNNSMIPKANGKGNGIGRGNINGAKNKNKETQSSSSTGRQGRSGADDKQHMITTTGSLSSVSEIAAVVWPFFYVNECVSLDEEYDEDGSNEQYQEQVVLLAQGYVLTEAEIKAAKEEENQLLISQSRRGTRQSQRRSRGESMSAAGSAGGVDVMGSASGMNGAGNFGERGEEGQGGA
ncbi:hypothetical protein V8F20_002771 [Naviculisporaceae sp. PSN 640]